MEKKARFGLRLKYIVEDVDRHGNIRIYVRVPGRRKIRIRGLPGSTEFLTAYQHAVDGITVPVPSKAAKAPLARYGTFRWLCQDYFGSTEFKMLDSRTQRIRRNTLERISEAHGDKLVSAMEVRHIIAIRDSVSSPKHEAANTVLKVMRQVLSRGVQVGLIKQNLAREVKYLHNGSQGFHTWTPAEIKQFQDRHAIGTQARLAMSLMLFLGQRKSDAVKFGRQQIRNGKFYFTQTKNRSRKPVDLVIPIANELQKVIDLTPKTNLLLLVTQWGKPFTANGFGNKFRKWCDEAGLPQCSSHGLRKACAAILAELGCNEMEIKAITGHRTTKQISIYTRDANMAHLAEQAIGKLDRHMAGFNDVPPEGGGSGKWDRNGP